MSAESVCQFAQSVLSNKATQRELQKVMNDLASSVAEIGQNDGCQITVQDVGQFLMTTFFPDGSTPDSPVYERRQWLPIIQGMLTQLKVSNPDNKMFQTMSFDNVDDESGELKSLLDAVRNQNATPAAATPAPAVAAAAVAAAAPAIPAPPAVDAFEPEESYFEDNQSNVAQELAAAQQRIAEMEGAMQTQPDKPFWKVW